MSLFGSNTIKVDNTTGTTEQSLQLPSFINAFGMNPLVKAKSKNTDKPSQNSKSFSSITSFLSAMGAGLSILPLGGEVPLQLQKMVQPVQPTPVTQAPTPVTPKQMPIPAASPSNTVGGYNLAGYATDPSHIGNIQSFYNQYANTQFNTPQVVQSEIDRLMKANNQASPPVTPLTGQIILDAATKYGVDPRLLFSLFRQESSAGINMLTPNNPGNINNTDYGRTQGYATIQEGVEAAARELARRKVLSMQQ